MAQWGQQMPGQPMPQLLPDQQQQQQGRLPDREAAYYKKLFRLADSQNTGIVSQDTAVNLLQSSNIDRAHLEAIWNAIAGAVAMRSGSLDFDIFCTLMRMVAHVQAGNVPLNAVSLDLVSREPMRLPHFPNAPPPQAGPGGGADRVAPSAVDCRKWARLFLRTDTDHDGLVGANDAKMLLERSGLPQELLERIWHLSDVNRDGSLSWAEFVAAMHLVRKARSQQPLPDPMGGLPAELTSFLGTLQSCHELAATGSSVKRKRREGMQTTDSFSNDAFGNGSATGFGSTSATPGWGNDASHNFASQSPQAFGDNAGDQFGGSFANDDSFANDSPHKHKHKHKHKHSSKQDSPMHTPSLGRVASQDDFATDTHADLGREKRDSFGDLGSRRQSRDDYRDKELGSRERRDDYRDREYGERGPRDDDRGRDFGGRERRDDYRDRDFGGRERRDDYRDRDFGARERRDDYRDRDFGGRERRDDYRDKDFGGRDRRDGGKDFARDKREDYGMPPHGRGSSRPSSQSRFVELLAEQNAQHDERDRGRQRSLDSKLYDPAYEARLREIFGERHPHRTYRRNLHTGALEEPPSTWAARPWTSSAAADQIGQNTKLQAEASKVLPYAVTAPFLRTVTSNFSGGTRHGMNLGTTGSVGVAPPSVVPLASVPRGFDSPTPYLQTTSPYDSTTPAGGALASRERLRHQLDDLPVALSYMGGSPSYNLPPPRLGLTPVR